MRRRGKGQGWLGFTLIELLVVVVMIGLLAGLVGANVRNRKELILARSCYKAFKQVTDAQIMHYTDFGQYAVIAGNLINHYNPTTQVNSSYMNYWLFSNAVGSPSVTPCKNFALTIGGITTNNQSYRATVQPWSATSCLMAFNVDNKGFVQFNLFNCTNYSEKEVITD